MSAKHEQKGPKATAMSAAESGHLHGGAFWFWDTEAREIIGFARKQADRVRRDWDWWRKYHPCTHDYDPAKGKGKLLNRYPEPPLRRDQMPAAAEARGISARDIEAVNPEAGLLMQGLGTGVPGYQAPPGYKLVPVNEPVPVDAGALGELAPVTADEMRRQMDADRAQRVRQGGPQPSDDPNEETTTRTQTRGPAKKA